VRGSCPRVTYTAPMATGGSFNLPFAGDREIYSVSELNREARRVIETHFGTIWVEGEISNLARPSSGHMYFSLKDADAQLRCAMFRQYGRTLAFEPDNGQQVLARGRVSLYEARGEFQLVVDYMESAGEGALRRRFEQLKAKLAAEGLFDAERKRPLPRLPERIAVVTSPSGAAIRDVLTALKRRFPAVDVLIYPSPVQGEGAAEELSRMLRLAEARGDCDLIILTRGGGSLEDLWSFNEEMLARTMAGMTIPIICGVGHETDFTIADFVADLRAPTPSQAAELAVPDQAEWLMRLARIEQQLVRTTKQSAAAAGDRLAALAHRLGRAHPGAVLRERAQRLDGLEYRLLACVGERRRQARAAVEALFVRIRARDPRQRIAFAEQRRRQFASRLRFAITQTAGRTRSRLTVATRTLESLSPLATLERGYAIVTLADGKSVVTDAGRVETGDHIGVRLAHGSLSATVDTAEPES
jgi:exodeoxyribonuclease VII large subunit